MVDFIQLQDMIKDQLALDRSVKAVTAKGSTLEEAAAEAATLLDIPVRRLEYEITEKGSSGFLGTGKKEWVISAYERKTAKIEQEAAKEPENETEDKEFIEDLDGDAFVHLNTDGVYLKIIPPKGRGKKIPESETKKIIENRMVADYDAETVTRAVREAKGEYIRIGDFQHNPINDCQAMVSIQEGEMKAFITVTPPGAGGCDISVETLLSYLRNSRVVHGVNEELLSDFADRPIYREKITVAEGTKPVNGRDAYIQYNFETDQSRLKLREGSNGRIDFKELNIIQNVVQNQHLAKKIPPEEGVMGRTVTGKVIPAKNGKNINLPLGKNVHLGDDEATIISDISGQVVQSGGKINVEPIYTVNGDVNLKTGNIIFLGTVIINGNVEDGFSVKAAGNIEVNGTVEKAELDAEGDIIVHQGITGKNTGLIKAGRSIWARFIENSIIDSGNMVVVSDGIINSQVNAYKRIICQGKRAHIVGGRLRASEEINAKILGNPTSGTDTVCEVGFDPKSKEQLETLTAGREGIEKKLEEIQLNLQTLINIKKQRKTLPEDKEAYLHELMDQRQLLMGDLRKTKEGIAKLQEFLTSIKTRGRISASSKVYPGVRVFIRDASSEIRTEYRAVTFILEDGLIRVTKYEEPSDETRKAPDGYAAN
ncbi:MAG: FapA family protein [Treponema sp.]|nr:FapA family protein [Treponema sp.]